MFFKIESQKKNMLQNLKKGSKCWKILKMKIILTIILINNGKKIETILKETKQQLTEKDESTETLKNRWYDEE